MRILVVEDETTMAESLRSGLEGEGFAVDVAGDGEEGLWYADEVDYDAIILDLMLPKVNGFQVCAALRARDDWTPILMLTAKDGHLDEAEGWFTQAYKSGWLLSVGCRTSKIDVTGSNLEIGIFSCKKYTQKLNNHLVVF